jgi:hypothetical protein
MSDKRDILMDLDELINYVRVNPGSECDFDWVEISLLKLKDKIKYIINEEN